MATRHIYRALVLAFLILASVPGHFGNRAMADEPCEKFLQALRDVGMFDVALDYLDQMENSPLANEAFKRKIPLAKVSVLLDEITQIRDPQKITQRLDLTEQVIKSFIDSKPSALLLSEAQQQQSRLALARARRMLQRAESDRITVDQKKQLQTRAREYLQQAASAYESIRDRLRNELENFENDAQDRSTIKRREAIRNQYVKARLQSPKIKEQVADSYGPDHPQYKTLLSEAAAENLELYSKYRTRLSGIEGAINAGRCYYKLGEPEKALGYLVEIFSLPRGQAQALKKRDAALVALDCWESMQNYPVEEVFVYLQTVIYSLTPEFRRSPDGARLLVAFAKACRTKADKIRKDGVQNPEQRREMTMLLNEATSIMRSVVRLPGPYRTEAAKILADWGNSVADMSDSETGPPKTMADARQRAKDIQLQVAELSENLGRLRADLSRAENDEQKSKTTLDIEAKKKQIDELSNAALNMLKIAFSMVKQDTAQDDITNLRYLQSTSYFQMERYFETTIIGEFLMKHHPGNSGTRQAAGLVCKSYWQLYRSDESEDKQFELGQLKKHCDFVFDNWPGSPQAESAGLLMTLVSLNENDAVAADSYLTNIPEDSPNRSKIILEVGNRLWQQYVKEKKQSTGMSDDQRLGIRSKAQLLLEQGLAALKVENLNSYEARAALSLTEIYLDSGMNDAAIAQLEDAAIAPLDLVKQKHPATNKGNFRRDVYKTAIRAYLAQLKTGEDSLRWVEKSQGVISALKSEIGDTPDGRRQLAGIYLTISRELNQQFQSLETIDQKRSFAEGLESFLMALRTSASDRQLLLLTGTMLAEIGQSLSDTGIQDQSRRFFGTAVEVFRELKQQDEPDNRTKLAIDRGLANSLRGQGRYEDAVKQFGDILADPQNQKYVDVQIEAAKTFQEWGVAKKLTDPLAKSIMGGQKRSDQKGRPVNVIWGWTKLAKAARRAKKPELFAQSVYNLALSKYEYGRVKKDPKMQQSAIAEIEKYKKNVPEMGGSNWLGKFDSLLQRMKSGLGNW